MVVVISSYRDYFFIFVLVIVSKTTVADTRNCTSATMQMKLVGSGVDEESGVVW